MLAAFAITLTAKASSPSDAAQWLQNVIAPCFSQNDKISSACRAKIESEDVTPELKALLARDNADAERTHEVTRLDFDWIINAQDIPDSWSVGKPYMSGHMVIVPVQTRWSGNHRANYSFVLEPSGKHWLISDVQYSNKRTLIKILQQPL